MNLYNSIKYRLNIFNIRRQIISNGGGISKNVNLSISGDFRCGKGVILNSTGIDLPQWSHILVNKNALLEIGDYSGLSSFSIHCKNHIKIGNYVNIGAGCLIMDSNFHNIDWRVRRNCKIDTQTAKTASIVIEDDVFIGARSIICKGVTIGARTVIAAGSVVVHNIPSDCIAGGNPCKVIKYIKQDK